MAFVYAPGQTPLDPDEMGGLKPRHITNQKHLNAWEQVNILAGRFQAFRQSKKVELLDENFIRRLHLKLLGDTWSWAGTFRTTDKSIGVAAEKVLMRLVQLVEKRAISGTTSPFRSTNWWSVFTTNLCSSPLRKRQRTSLTPHGRRPGPAPGLFRFHRGSRHRHAETPTLQATLFLSAWCRRRMTDGVHFEMMVRPEFVKGTRRC